jgi:trigger factor
MQIEVKEVEPCKLYVHYTADAADILNKRGEVIGFFKKAPVPGFRPGKATLDAIKMHYRSQIEDSLKRALVEDAYHNTLFEKKIKPHGAPIIENILMLDGKFTCEFQIHVKPEFDIAVYKGLEVVKPHDTENTAEVTEKMLQELRVRFGEVSPYSEDDFVQIGDNVIVDYDCFIDDTKVDNLCAKGEMVSVGNSQLIDFDNNLLGMKIGESREFDLIIPEDGRPSLVGKRAHFKVSVNMGSKVTPCALDDSLAVKLGKNNMNELREFIHASANGKIIKDHNALMVNTVSNKLVDINKIDVPNWMSLSEAKYLAHNSKLNWDVLPDEDREKFLLMSEKNVKLSLILDKIRELEPDAQLSDNEVFDMIKKNIANSKIQTSFDDVIKEMNRTGYLQILMSRIRDEYTLDFVMKNIKIVE